MMQLDLFEVSFSIQKGDTKVCVYCKTKKHVSSFPRHIAHKDNLDTRCKTCIRENAFVRRSILKTAPDKPKTCECCLSTPKDNKFVLDHCHKTLKFRGWLCDHCNLALGLLGDDLTGLQKAIEYLRKSDEQ